MIKNKPVKIWKIKISDLALLELQELQLKTQSQTIVELIKNCLSLLRCLVEESEKGNQILVRDDYGRTVKEMIILRK